MGTEETIEIIDVGIIHISSYWVSQIKTYAEICILKKGILDLKNIKTNVNCKNSTCSTCVNYITGLSCTSSGKKIGR